MDHQLLCNSHDDDDGNGWTKVVSQKQKPADVDVSCNTRRFLTPTTISADVENESNSDGDVRSKRQSDGYSEEEDKKKPIVSLSEALAKIDQSSLAAFLVESMEKFSNNPETQLRRFVDYIGRELTEVRFPWLEMFPLEGPWPKLMDVINVPFSDIPEPIYKTSVDWINQVSLPTFCGPTALTLVLSSLRERPIFQGQDKLPLTVWIMAQTSQGDLSLGLFSWARNLLPVLGDTNCNPQSRDLILQLVENFHKRILSDPKARTTLMNRAVSEGERLIPLPSFEILLRLTFPASSARVEATQRFEAIYPILKEVALAGAQGSNAMKQVIQEIFTFSLKLAGEENPALAKEATTIASWCVPESIDCCKDWEYSLYKANLEASVAVLKKLVDEWKDHSLKLSSSPSNSLSLSQIMKSFRVKNKKAITYGRPNAFLYKEADKFCKVILRRLSRGSYSYYCLKATTITAVVLAAAVLSSNPEATTELKNLVNSLDLHLYRLY